ncbi:hypothetical protein [Allorhodopirellula heiligendammensis]|uniref:Archaeal TRASH domain protein n=1 Tax=Allorhodopirellula heiligendammensis TaxID=2714739 RepID=A0A5C6BWT1_9BACT|nr:hypothetical protein [Allorhodopirellula heiligendammensis]TWU15139.1 Archaeal TRASH domain protein [Allorhodopirellula heiligendammensis]
MKRKILLSLALLASMSVSTAMAQHIHAERNHEMPGDAAVSQISEISTGPHGGSLKQSETIQLETVVSQSGIEVFVFDLDGQPVAVDGGRGAASLRVEGNAKRYRYDLLPDGKGGLIAPVDLSEIAGLQIEIQIQLVGLHAVGSRAVRLNEVATVPIGALQLASAAITRQKICPVTGKPLGSMGDPVAVDVNDQRVFVCCAGCVGALESEPAKYVGGRPQIKIETATAADVDAIERQQVCPVMDEPLGGMGTPVKVLIGDKPIFLCCRGCIKKLEAEPAKYLAMIQGTRSVSMDDADSGSVPAGTEQVRAGVFRITAADEPFVAAQKQCPVMNEPLDAMGGPYKVHAGGKAIYICCPGCAKKIIAEPQKWLAELARQGVDAPRLR